MPIIEVEDLHKTYHTAQLDTPVLHGIDLRVASGEFVAIMGPSGCGKSTLLYCLGLMARYDGGRLAIGGRDVAELGEGDRARLRRTRMAFIFQRFNLLPALSAEENVAMPLRLQKRTAGHAPEQLLGRVGLAEKRAHRPSALSMGERQRVAIARGLAGGPDILFADEPTGNLDSESGKRVLELLSEFHQSLGQTILMVTHDAAAAKWADRVVRMRDGRFVDA